MATTISNSFVHWCQVAVLEPPCEGAARINRCFRGVDLHQIDHPKLDWSQRVVDLLSGVLLMIPILNTIVWIFIRTFGNAQILSQPLNPPHFVQWSEATTAAAEPILEEIPALAPLENEAPATTKTFTCLDKTDSHPDEFEAHWSIKSYADVKVVTRISPYDTSNATYNHDWQLQSLDYVNPGLKVDVNLQRKHNTIVLTGTKDEEEINDVFVLENPNIPWIQQSVGFRPFVLSPENELTFFAIRPDDRTIREFCATKTERSTLPGYGRSLKIETTFNSWALNKLFGTIGECWFNPTTADQYIVNYNVKLIAWGQSKLQT